MLDVALRIFLLILFIKTTSENASKIAKLKQIQFWTPRVRFMKSMANFTCNGYTNYVFMKCSSTDHLTKSFFNKYFHHVNETDNWTYIRNISEEYVSRKFSAKAMRKIEKWRQKLKELVNVYIFQYNPKLRTFVRIGYPENVLRDFKTFEHNYFDCIRHDGSLLLNYFDIYLLTYITVINELYNSSLATRDYKSIAKTEGKLKETLAAKLREYIQFLTDFMPKNSGPRCNHIKIFVEKETPQSWELTQKWPKNYLCLGDLLRSKLYKYLQDKGGFKTPSNSTQNFIKYRSWVENMVTGEKYEKVSFECCGTIDPYHCDLEGLQRVFPTWEHDRDECYKHTRESSKKFRERHWRLKRVYHYLQKLEQNQMKRSKLEP